MITKPKLEIRILNAIDEIMRSPDKRVTQYKIAQVGEIHRETVNRFFRKLNLEKKG